MTIQATYIVTRKLFSSRGTLLGTVNYPEEWDRRIQHHGSYSFRWMSGIRYLGGDSDLPQEIPPVRTFGISESYRERGAVEIWGVTLEEFEQMPDCSFSPSMAYIRSLMG